MHKVLVVSFKPGIFVLSVRERDGSHLGKCERVDSTVPYIFFTPPYLESF